MKAVLTIKPDGSVDKRLSPKTPDYDVIRLTVGGPIEVVPGLSQMTHEGRRYTRGTAYVSEIGMLQRLPLNERATELWLENLGSGPFWYEPRLYGTVMFVATEREK